jgi:hypothetical protein
MHTRSSSSLASNRGRLNAAVTHVGTADVIRRTDPRQIFMRAPMQLQLAPTIPVRGDNPDERQLKSNEHMKRLPLLAPGGSGTAGSARRLWEGHLKLDGPALWKVSAHLLATLILAICSVRWCLLECSKIVMPADCSVSGCKGCGLNAAHRPIQIDMTDDI